MSNEIIVALISGTAMIIAAWIANQGKSKSDNKETNATKDLDSNTSKEDKKHKRKNGFILILVLFGFLTFGLALYLLFSQANQSDNSPWVGNWMSYEKWEKGISEGTITFLKDTEDKIQGVSYNKQFEKMIIEGEIKGNTLEGTWENLSTKKTGKFRFELNEEKIDFTGKYTMGIGGGNDWDGQKFTEKTYTHQINMEDANDKEINFRTRSLTSKEYNEGNQTGEIIAEDVLIGKIKHLSKIKFLEEQKNAYKIVAIIDGELRIGFIAKKFNGKNTINKL
jgi:hypothetical protein